MDKVINLTLLDKKQQEKILSLYNGYITDNKRKSKNRKSNRNAVKISKEEFQGILFRRRDRQGDIYMDVNKRSFPEYEFVHYNEDTGMIEEWKPGRNKPIRKFVAKDYIPNCDHFSDSLIDELDDQVSYCTGGNYSRYDDIYRDVETNPNSLLGYHTLENGITFYGMVGTNDCTWAVFFILYYDGKKIRGYVPKEGNQYCKETCEAWGQMCSSKENESKKEELYKLLDSHSYFDYDRIKEDILSEIKIKQ